ncbi:DNA-3-methyladenine glycosylase I [Treponema sp.]
MEAVELQRCPWCLGDIDYQNYHDTEWGRPLRDSGKLFALLILEGAQAGLSWLTILKRRGGYLQAFDSLDAEKMALYGPKETERLMADPGIIRNRRKIESAIGNARAYLELCEEEGSFSTWLWNFVDGKPIVKRPRSMAEVPASTALSEKISKELKMRGFSFVGPTIVYAYLQSAGLVNEHLEYCFCAKPTSGA